jgi:uncharacterized protein YndB with AHSA1/START domain
MSRVPQFFPRDARVVVILGLALGWLALLTRPALAAEPQVTEGFINTSPAEVWRIFTTSEGYKLTGAALADVDLKIGGVIRAHYNPQGKLGDAETIVNEILAYEPERMLAMRIKQAPATFPYKDAVAGTWTVIYMNPAGDNMTQVRIIGLGYTDTPPSQAMRKYFAEGNRWTLDHIGKRFWPKCPKCVADEAAAQP